MRRFRFLVLVILCFATACSPASAPRGHARASSSKHPARRGGGRPPDLVVAVKGDWGAGTVEQRAVTAEMCALRRVEPFTDVLTVGENFYEPDGRATSANYTQPERCLVTGAGFRWRASWGNHDVAGDATRTVLGAQRYYTWSAAGVDFFVLDSNNVRDSAQQSWLARALSASRARIRIVSFHHSPFSSGGHMDNESVQRAWVPLFEQFHVTLVLTGHSHGYEHAIVRGVNYVVTGGGGRYLTPCARNPPILIQCTMAHHFLVIEVRGARVTVRAITPSGEEIDRFTVAA